MTAPDEPLTILYQDEWLVAVDKPAGHLVHPADIPKEGDMVTMKILRDQIGRHVYNIHRIDRPTTGVLLFALARNTARSLHRALERHEVCKKYWAVVSGPAPDEPWECRLPLQKNPDSPVQEARTGFQRLTSISPTCLSEETTPVLSLVEATPHTGRYHQIRRHLIHLGLPIVGDYRYAGIEASNLLGKSLGTGTRMLLQSKSLSLTHPVTGQHTHIEAPVDPAFLKCFPDLVS
ncbi:MAG: hypothetical protein H7A51_11595 [Akkermansiaceae bacterium]|nr:hypothetical protein [Akkermansiaceae bacterium]